MKSSNRIHQIARPKSALFKSPVLPKSCREFTKDELRELADQLEIMAIEIRQHLLSSGMEIAGISN